jgi:hypothetical protein
VPLIPRRSEKEQYSTEDTTIILKYDKNNTNLNSNYLNWVYRAFDRNNETSADVCHGSSFSKDIEIGYQN